MAMALLEDLGDFEHVANDETNGVTQRKPIAKGGAALLTAVLAVRTLRKRNLALTSPSPALGERRACIPVAQ
jgi:hypothetical protein